MNKLIIIIVLLFSGATCSFAQDVKEENKILNKAEQAAKNTKPFSMDYFKNKDNQHFVLVVKISDGRISREVPSLELRQGKIQKVYTSGSFKVAWLNREGKEMGSYNMEDPTTVRTWEKPEIKKIKSGKVELKLPKDGSISTVIFSLEGKETNRWKIGEQVNKLIER